MAGLPGIIAEAEEVGLPPGEGFEARMVGDHDSDPYELLATVRARLRADVGRLGSVGQF